MQMLEWVFSLPISACCRFTLSINETAAIVVTGSRGTRVASWCVPESSDASLPSCTFDVFSGTGAFIAFPFVFMIM